MSSQRLPAGSLVSSRVVAAEGDRLAGVAAGDETLARGLQLVADPHREVGSSGGTVLGVHAQVNLAAVVAFEPHGVGPGQDLRTRIDPSIAENVLQERHLGVHDSVGHSKVHMIERGHG